MDVAQLIQQKLNQLGLEQRGLADASEVTESYTSQLLSWKKMPPAPERTHIYDRLGKALKLPSGKLASLADLQSGNRTSKIPGLGCIAGSTPLPPRVGRSGQISKTRGDRSADPSGHRRVLTASFRLANWKRISYAYFAMVQS